MNTLLKQNKEFEKIFTKRYGTAKPSFKSFYWQRPEKIWNWIEKAIKEAREEGIKFGKEAGVKSTYPVTNLDDESKNCEICNHDHSLASKECRCDCCILNTKQEI